MHTLKSLLCSSGWPHMSSYVGTINGRYWDIELKRKKDPKLEQGGMWGRILGELGVNMIKIHCRK